MAITDTQAKIDDIVNKSLSPNADTLGDVMRMMWQVVCKIY